jgi:hypothetical protein
MNLRAAHAPRVHFSAPVQKSVKKINISNRYNSEERLETAPNAAREAGALPGS